MLPRVPGPDLPDLPERPARPARPALVALLVAGAAGVALAVSAAPAGATSCAVDEAVTPEAVAAATAPVEGGFFSRWDFAVVGTVTAIRTDERQGSPTYGDTEIEVLVTGVLGAPTAPDAITLRAHDPGWMNGYPFEVGTSYFVPVQARSPDGVVNFTFLCDPISTVADAEASAVELAALADAAGISFGVPGSDGPGGPPGEGASGGGASWFVPAASAAAVLAAVGSLVVLWRRPLRPGSDLVVVGGGDEGLQGRRGPA